MSRMRLIAPLMVTAVVVGAIVGVDTVVPATATGAVGGGLVTPRPCRESGRRRRPCSTTTTVVTTTTVQPTTTVVTGTTTTSTVAPTSTAATTSSTTAPPPIVAGPSGTFVDTFSDLTHWSFAHWRNEIPGNAAAASTATVVSGEARIVAADQNYGDATLRSDTKYDLSTGGQIRVTIRDDGGGLPLIGSAFVGFTDLPYNAPSITRDNGQGPTPESGVYVQLRDNCRVPWGGPQISTYLNHVESVATLACLGSAPSGPVEMRYAASGLVEFWAGGVKYAQGNQVLPTTGFLSLGVHNHASVKYSAGGTQSAVTGWFDNVSYPAGTKFSTYRNGQSVTSIGESASVVFTAYQPTGIITINGQRRTFVPATSGSGSVAGSVSIPVSNLRLGDNTIVVGGTTVANVDLLIGGGTTSRPPTTTTSSSSSTTTTTTTTAPRSSSTTVPPGTVPGAAGTQFSESFATDARQRFDWRLQTTNEPPTGDFLGEHDMSMPCGSPTTYRTVHQPALSATAHSNVDVTNSELVWWCAPGNDGAKGHMMTALDTLSIATLSFSPKQTFTNVTRVCWDQNMNNLGEGKWVNVYVVPAADVVAHGGDLAYADGVGIPFGGIPMRLPPGAFDFDWLRGSIHGFKIGADGSYNLVLDQWKSVTPGGMATESASRFTICLDSGAGVVTLERPDGSVDTYPLGARFPTGAVRVIWQDASYNPVKHNGEAHSLTWHWDNIEIT